MDHVMAECHMDLHGFSLTVSMDRCHSENPSCDAVKQRRHAVCCVSSRRKVDIRWSMTFLMFHSILVEFGGAEKGWQHPCCVGGALLQWGVQWGLYIAQIAPMFGSFCCSLKCSMQRQKVLQCFLILSYFIIILSFFGPYIVYCSRLITSFNILQC